MAETGQGMKEILGRYQPQLGYLGAALLGYGALGPVASSSFFETLYYIQSFEGFLLIGAALASAMLVYLKKCEWLWLTASLAGILALLELIHVAVGTDAGAGQLAALPLGAAFSDFGNSYWGTLRIGWGSGFVILATAVLMLAAIPAIPAAKARLVILSRTKAYDVIIALPLALYYLRGVLSQFPTLTYRFGELGDGSASLTGTLQLITILSSISFSLLLIVLIFIRSVPVGKARDLLPRIVAVLGTFAVTTILYFPAVDLPLWLQIAAACMSIAGNGLSFLVLFRLGRSFSIMPEARSLITTGPYALVRHPLYLVEELAIVGFLIQFASLLALGLGLAHLALQYLRTEYEEQVLSQSFPDYGTYRAKVRWRFIPGLI